MEPIQSQCHLCPLTPLFLVAENSFKALPPLFASGPWNKLSIFRYTHYPPPLGCTTATTCGNCARQNVFPSGQFLICGSHYSLDFQLIHYRVSVTNIYLSVLYVYVCGWVDIYTPHAYGSLQESEEGVRFPGTGVVKASFTCMVNLYKSGKYS